MGNANAIPIENNVQARTGLAVSFRQKELLLVDRDGTPYVPMKPVVDGMGLDWKSQHRKLVGGRFESTMVEMTIVAQDGKSREMTCLPLRKLTGWLMSIHPNKVRPELRDGIIAYQNECDDALWEYWNEGHAVRDEGAGDALSIIGRTIGTDGFHCLAAVVDGKVKRLPAALRRGAKNHIWSQVHKAFSVVTAEDIPAGQLDAARNFVAAYALDGEWLPKEKRTQDKDRESFLPPAQARDIADRLARLGMLFHPFSEQFGDVAGIGRSLRGLHPRLGMRDPSYRQVIQISD